MAKFNLRPTPMKIIIPVILAISLIIVTFYGKAIMSDYPACELRDVYFKIQEARRLNDTSTSTWTSINNSLKFIQGKAIKGDTMRAISSYYAAVTYLNPFLEDLDIDAPPMNLFGQKQADCFIELVAEANKGSTLGYLFEFKNIDFNPYYSFKNLFINSLVLFIEAYLLICVIEFMKNMLPKKVRIGK
jgi:hypothetical protein